MNISACVENRQGSHAVAIATNGQEKLLVISPKPEGFVSSVNGGELLLLALATCYRNDVYREARKRDIPIRSVRVEVTGEFGGEGEGARNVSYHATIEGAASREELLALMRHTDTVAEIQNTVRSSVPVQLIHFEAIAI